MLAPTSPNPAGLAMSVGRVDRKGLAEIHTRAFEPQNARGNSMARADPGPFMFYLFVLLTLRMSLIALLVCCLRVLFSTARVLFALGVIALAVMFGGGTMFLGCIIVMFGCFIVFIFSHDNPLCCWFTVGVNRSSR